MQKKKKPVSWKHRLQTAAGAFFCLLLIPLLLMNSVLIIKGYLHRDQVPGIAGIFPMVILTDSMYPELASGDLIFCRCTAAEDVRVGDVICFYDPAGNGSTTVTHRVEEIQTEEDGSLTWTTRGDANNTKDAQAVPAKNLVGVYRTKLKGLGNVVMFLQTRNGFLISVVCPVLLWMLYDLMRRRKDTNVLKAELEALRAEKESR